MKKLLIIVLLSVTANAQVSVSAAFDPKMAIDGAYETSNRGSLDLILRVADRTRNLEVGFQLEYFKDLKPSYFSYGMFANKIIPIGYKHELYAGVEANLLMRKLERSTAGFLSVGANAGYRFYIGNFGIGLEANYKTRPDFKGLWNSSKKGTESGYITFTYKFNKL